MNFTGLFFGVVLFSSIFFSSILIVGSGESDQIPEAGFRQSTLYSATPEQQKNTRPHIAIIEPKNKARHTLNSLIRYSVTVSDVEDGESKYGEILSHEVFVEQRFMEGTPPVSRQEIQIAQEQPIGLTIINSSDCFSCHQFKNKLIGPSFQEIANRYSRTPAAIKLLAQRIREGSTGIWSEIVMPAHSDISSTAAEDIVDWILKNGANPNVNYMVGKEGSVKLELPPGARDGYFTLKASYTDKGLREKPNDKMTGEDMIILLYE